MAWMSDGTDFCGDTKGQESASYNYTQLCVPLVDRGVVDSTYTGILSLMIWFDFTLLVHFIIKKRQKVL